MVIGEAINATSSLVNLSSDLIGGAWQTWMLALKIVGGIVSFWIVVQLISIFMNWRRYREIAKIKEDLIRIEAKLDKVLKKKK